MIEEINSEDRPTIKNIDKSMPSLNKNKRVSGEIVAKKEKSVLNQK